MTIKAASTRGGILMADGDFDKVVDDFIEECSKQIDLVGHLRRPRGILTKEVVGLELTLMPKKGARIVPTFSDPVEIQQYEEIMKKLEDSATAKFTTDPDSRQVIWTSDSWCPAAIHILLRDDKVFEVVFFRSIGLRKLTNDIKAVAHIAQKFANKYNKERIVVHIFISSLHKYLEGPDAEKTAEEIT
jgi:hypothetical protein